MLQTLKLALRRTGAFRRYQDLVASRRLRRWTDADERMRRFYSGLVPEGGLVFDVGANMGNRTKVFLAMGCRVVSVEPQPRCAAVLREAFGERPGFALVEKAVGAVPGRAELLAGSSHTLATLNREWIRATTDSGRFAGEHWTTSTVVDTVTLDALVAAHGVPDFVKIDVEGFELQVLRGLTRPVGGVSIEFAPEFLDQVVECVERLRSVGLASFALSLGESMEFEESGWTDAAAIAAILRRYAGRVEVFGDVYARP